MFFFQGAWCADHSKAVAKDKNQYLMVDLYKPGIKVGMVETQGQSAYDNSVTKFSLSFSNDGVNWTPYGKVCDWSWPSKQHDDRTRFLSFESEDLHPCNYAITPSRESFGISSRPLSFLVNMTFSFCC